MCKICSTRNIVSVNLLISSENTCTPTSNIDILPDVQYCTCMYVQYLLHVLLISAMSSYSTQGGTDSVQRWKDPI